MTLGPNHASMSLENSQYIYKFLPERPYLVKLKRVPPSLPAVLHVQLRGYGQNFQLKEGSLAVSHHGVHLSVEVISWLCYHFAQGGNWKESIEIQILPL